MLGQGIATIAKQTVNGNEVKPFEQHLKETLEARKHRGASAVAETLSPYQDAERWPQFPVTLPQPMQKAVKKREYAFDIDEDEDAEDEGGCGCCNCFSIELKCGARKILYGISCVMMMCCMQGLILRKAVGFLLKRKWRSKVEGGIDLQVLVIFRMYLSTRSTSCIVRKAHLFCPAYCILYSSTKGFGNIVGQSSGCWGCCVKTFESFESVRIAMMHQNDEPSP